MALTDRAVRLAKPQGGPYKLADSDGLYLFVSPAGSKSWRFDYRLHGKRRTFTIGQYPDVTLAEARSQRNEARRLIAEGTDPTARRKAEVVSKAREAENTFLALANRHIETLKGQGRAESTISKNEWLRDMLKGDLGSKPITSITTPEILETLRKIETAGKYETALRARNFISNVFRIGIFDGLVNTDPTYPLLRALRTPVVEHHPAIIREDELGKLLREIHSYTGTVSVREGLKFLSLCFVRPMELRFAKWDEFDLRERIWRIPAERMKMRRPHDVPLSDQAHKLLHGMRKHSRQDSFVFPHPHRPEQPLSENGWNSALKRMGYRKLHTPHGFRSSASTILNERGFRVEAIDMQLSHFEGEGKEKSVRKIYNRALYWSERVQIMQEWADLLDDLRTRDTG